MCTKCKIQFIAEGIFQVIEQWAPLHIIRYTLLNKLKFTSGTHFVDLAVKM